MKPEELRIGNYVKRSMPNHDLEMDRHTCQISSGDLYAYSHHIYRPIQLNDEWAVKFGYECLLELSICINEDAIFEMLLRSKYYGL